MVAKSRNNDRTTKVLFMITDWQYLGCVTFVDYCLAASKGTLLAASYSWINLSVRFQTAVSNWRFEAFRVLFLFTHRPPSFKSSHLIHQTAFCFITHFFMAPKDVPQSTRSLPTAKI